MKDKRKTIFVIRFIAGLLIIAFWIFLFAWADEKYLIQNSFPDREPPLFTLFGMGVYLGGYRDFSWLCEYQWGRYFLTGVFYSGIIFAAAQWIIKRFCQPKKANNIPTRKNKEKVSFLAAKILASQLLTALDLVFFMWGIAFLYGGPDGGGITAATFVGAVLFLCLSALFVLGILKIWQFNKKVTLASLSLHEIVLFVLVVWTSISSIAAGKLASSVGTLFIAWLLLLAGGYGIFKTAKAIKAEDDK
ncbi:MAG: hypothetical protein IKD10_05130 [Lentisphaeria bacterium]|nr:hypothetical protein [Lentisphaeria bacterium]